MASWIIGAPLIAGAGVDAKPLLLLPVAATALVALLAGIFSGVAGSRLDWTKMVVGAELAP